VGKAPPTPNIDQTANAAASAGDPGVPPMNVQNPTDPSPQRYSNDDPRSHGILGPIDIYHGPPPPEPSWLTEQKWKVEEWTAERWEALKQSTKSLKDWFLN
jgi:hypothetical protein